MCAQKPDGTDRRTGLGAGWASAAGSNRWTFRKRATNGKAMKNNEQPTQGGGLRRLGALFIRMAVGFLLVSAIAVAVVAAGLDLLPLRP
jgi:hypothetical protein